MGRDHIEGFLLGLSTGVLLAYFFKMPKMNDLSAGSAGHPARAIAPTPRHPAIAGKAVGSAG